MTTYNGWANYETWNVNLWLDNEEGSYHDKRDIIRRAISVGDAARELKSYVEDMQPDIGASMFSDILNAALSEVDYHEIVEAEWSDLHDDEDEEQA